MDIMERLKIPGQERFQFDPALPMGGGQTRLQCCPKLGKGRIIVGVQTFLAHKPPKPFNQVEMWRERWQIQQLDPHCGGVVLNQRTFLIARVVEYHRDRAFSHMSGQFAQQLSHRFRSHRGLVHDGNDLFREGIHRTEDIEAFAP